MKIINWLIIDKNGIKGTRKYGKRNKRIKRND